VHTCLTKFDRYSDIVHLNFEGFHALAMYIRQLRYIRKNQGPHRAPSLTPISGAQMDRSYPWPESDVCQDTSDGAIGNEGIVHDDISVPFDYTVSYGDHHSASHRQRSTALKK
jgi:hypothetical protein